MVQAIPAVALAASASATVAAVVSIINAILINISLGAHRFVDEHGDEWEALDAPGHH